MPNCGCTNACTCAITAGSEGVTVTGTGAPTDPYVISVDPFEGAESQYVQKDELDVNVLDHGAVGNGTTDDSAAVASAVALAISSKRRLLFPPGTYLVDAPILIQSTSEFHMEMQGRLKRKNASVANALIYFKSVSGLRCGTLRTDGNVLNNQKVQSDTNTYPVDEAKHDVRIEDCTDVEIGVIDSKNPAGDTLYVTGTTARVNIRRVQSWSGQSSGRNGVSVVSGSEITIDTIVSIGTGCATGVIAMPGGFDIEPNSGQQVTDVVVGSIYVKTNGTSGFTMFGAYTGSGSLGAGVKQIRRVTVGRVILNKTSGVPPTASDMPFRGCDTVTVGSVTHTTDASNTNQALSIDDSNDIQMNVDIPRSGSLCAIGANAAVNRLTLRGRIGQSGSHCLVIYALNNSLIDMTLKNPVNGSMVINKNATGASDNVVFRGDWRKDSTGSWAMNIAGTVTNWLLDGVDMTGWPADGRVKGAGTPTAVDRRQVRGLTYGTAAPNFDAWGVGHFVENTAPSELGSAGSKYVIRGWVCTVAGTPGTWLQVRSLTGN